MSPAPAIAAEAEAETERDTDWSQEHLPLFPPSHWKESAPYCFEIGSVGPVMAGSEIVFGLGVGERESSQK